MIPEELVKKWRYRLHRADSAHKQWRESFRVEDLDRYWEGAQEPSWWAERFFIPINLIFSNIQNQMDFMLSGVPKFIVKPSRTYWPTPDMLQILSKQAELREAILNYNVREEGLKAELRKSLLDAFIAFGVIKNHYTPYHSENPRRGRTIRGTTQTEPDLLLSKEEFSFSRRDPMNIRFDPNADSLETIKWVAERIEMTLDEAKDNPLFKNTEDLKAFDIRIEEKESENRRKKGENVVVMTGGNSSLAGLALNDYKEEIVYVWEIYDLEENKIVCIAEGYDKALRDDPMPEGIEGHSYAFLYFIPRRNSPYPIPDIWHQVGPQDEYNVTRNQIMIHRRRFNRKYTYRIGSVDKEELDKVEDPVDGSLIGVKQDGDVIRPIKDAPLDQAVYFDVGMLRKDFMDVAGEAVPDSELAKIEKATVANLVADRQGNRRRGKLGMLQEFLAIIGRKQIQLYEAEMTLSVAVPITGQTGQEWLRIDPGDITSVEGEFHYEVDVTSLMPLIPEVERASWVGFLQLVAMNPQILQSPVLAKKTAQMFGRSE